MSSICRTYAYHTAYMSPDGTLQSGSVPTHMGTTDEGLETRPAEPVDRERRCPDRNTHLETNMACKVGRI